MCLTCSRMQRTDTMLIKSITFWYPYLGLQPSVTQVAYSFFLMEMYGEMDFLSYGRVKHLEIWLDSKWDGQLKPPNIS